MKENDLVKFKNPEAGEENLIMRVLEIRGVRVLVETPIPDMLIYPTNVYHIDILKPADNSQ